MLYDLAVPIKKTYVHKKVNKNIHGSFNLTFF